MITRLSAFALALSLAGVASAQVLYTGGTYTQEFDTLASSGTVARPTGPSNSASPAGQLFNNNSTLTGWVATFQNATSVGTTGVTDGNWIGAGVLNTPTPHSIPDFNTRFIRWDNGAGNGGSMYSYGTAASAERAFGALNSGGTTTPLRNAFGVRIQNAGTDLMTDPVVSYVGERWRVSGSTSADRLDFSYRIVAANSTFVIDDYRPTVTTGWTNLDALDFGLAVGTIGATDGNLAANRAALSATLTGLTLAPGEELQLRWTDFDSAGSDDGLAVDEFRFSATTAAVPEPATMAALGFGALALLRRRRKG